MFGRNKQRLVYQIKGEEKGRLQAFNAVSIVASSSYTQLLQGIIKREGIPQTEDVLFDSKTMTFIRKK